MNIMSLIFSLCLLVVSVSFGQSAAEKFLQSGFGKQASGDREGAIADFESATKHDPKLAEAYRYAGELKLNKGDFDGAIEAFTQAIILSEETKSIHTEFFYGMRSSAKLSKQDVSGALADRNECIKLSPGNYHNYRHRGVIFYLKHDWRSALNDFQSAIEHAVKWAPDGQEIDHVYIWIMRARLGERVAGDKELAEYVKNHANSPGAKWASKVAGVMLGQLPAKEIIPKSDPFAHWTEVVTRHAPWYYLGMSEVLIGNNDKAKELFTKCLELNKGWGDEGMFAESELKALVK